MATISVTLPSDGTTIDASDVSSPINTIVAEINGNLDDNNIKTGANINGAKLLAGSLPGTALDTTLASGWLDLADVPDTVTNNGNRSYDLVFNANDLTDTVSEGQRLRLTRTVSAPTQCADLESGSSQYFNKTSPAGLSFVDDFTCMGWVKLESYHNGGIIARRNADTEGWNLSVEATGQVIIVGLRIAGNNVVCRSYQSLPLNKWVHVAASMDLSGTSSLIYIDGVLVPSLTTVTGTCTALVQGTTALTVGAEKSAGTNPFDGKIAQAAVFSSVLSASTIRSYMSQTLSGAESTNVGTFTLNNSLVDTSSNANTVTASGGALATNVDSPFGSYLGGTLEYGIITKTAFSTNTTLTVQVPEGCAIPTSGGVSAVAYSTQKTPYKFPVGRTGILATSLLNTTATGTTISDVSALTLPAISFSGNIPVRIRVWMPYANTAGAAGQSFLAYIFDGATQIARMQFTTAASNYSQHATLETPVFVPTAGSHTYKVQAASSSGAYTVGGDPTYSAFISIEAVGLD